MGLVVSDHRMLLFEAAERGKSGVAAIAAELQAAYEDACHHVTGLDDDHGVLHLNAAYEAHVEALDELHAAYDAVPSRYVELCRSHEEAYVHVKLTIELSHLNLRLREFYDELRQLT